jgi:importin-5
MISSWQDHLKSIENILAELQSEQKTLRSSGEMELNELFTKTPGQLLQGLIEVSANESIPSNIRSLSLIIFRRLVVSSASENAAVGIDTSNEGIKAATVWWDRLTAEERSLIQEKAVHLLLNAKIEQCKSLRHKICDAIAQIARNCEAQTWPGLLSALTECSCSPEPSVRESAYWIIAARPEVLMSVGPDNLYHVQNLELVCGKFKNALTDSNVPVRLAALKASVQLIVNEGISRKSRQDLVTQLLELMANVLVEVANDSESLSEALMMFIDLAECVPKSFKPILPQLISHISSIISQASLEDSVRHNALELSVSFAENAPVMFRQLPVISSH